MLASPSALMMMVMMMDLATLRPNMSRYQAANETNRLKKNHKFQKLPQRKGIQQHRMSSCTCSQERLAGGGGKLGIMVM
jgi:hypothetical protein